MPPTSAEKKNNMVEIHEMQHANYLVTGGSGFVGQRLVEMLVERGAKRVISFDIAPTPKDALDDARIEYVQGDITDKDTVFGLVKGMDCVFHIAACVGPYHPQDVYERVNVGGTLNVIAACKHHGCKKMVYSSSPSTRFTGADLDGVTEDELPEIPMDSYVAEYAASKARGEVVMREALDDSFFACAIAPHQVYGPRDNLAMPNLLEAAGTGRMRIFGNGKNRICFTHVDNYCHGLILGERVLYKGSPALGKFYIVTDGDTHPFVEGYSNFYESLDEAYVGMGFTSIWSKYKLPYWLLMPIAYLCNFITFVTGMRLKLNPFTVTVLTMHRWFDISNAQRDLKYEPIVSFAEEWPKTIAWFKREWLPGFLEKQAGGAGVLGLAKKTQEKIDFNKTTESSTATDQKKKD